MESDTTAIPTILLISPDTELGQALLEVLKTPSRRLISVSSLQAGMRWLRRGEVDLTIVDEEAMDLPVDRLWRIIRQTRYGTTLLLLVAEGAPRDEQQLAATDVVLEKPVDPEQVREIVGRLEQRRRFQRMSGLIGRSEAMQQVIETVMQIAPMNVNVLITGESGTGKEVVARAIHAYSPRRDKPFMPINCGAIPENLIESELFGYERGAFTGAQGRRQGAFEAADGGTLLLDEIGEMPLMAQVKLLRVLEDKKIMRVGGRSIIQVDVRVLASTNKDLGQAVLEGAFRKDLYFRLKVMEIDIPPLRKRKEDIPPMVDAFIETYTREHHVQFGGISDEVLEALQQYDWPGNVRELRHTIERMIILSRGRPITQEDLPNYLEGYSPLNRNLPVVAGKTPEQSERELIYRALLDLRAEFVDLKQYIVDLKEYLMAGRSMREVVPYSHPLHDVDYTEEVADQEDQSIEDHIRPMEEVEARAIRDALIKTGGNKKRAAKALGIGERTIYRKLEKYGLK